MEIVQCKISQSIIQPRQGWSNWIYYAVLDLMAAQYRWQERYKERNKSVDESISRLITVWKTLRGAF